MKIQLSKMLRLIPLVLIMIALLMPQNIDAQRKKKKNKKEPIETVKKPEKPKKKTIADLVKSSKEIDGLFKIYQDTITGSLQMVISEDQINKEFIHFGQIANGVLDAGSFRGAYRGSRVFKIEKYFNKIEFITQNTYFYFDPSNAISKSKDANRTNANMASVKIEAYDKEKSLYLIKADDLFLKETFNQIKPAKRQGQSPTAFTLGNLDKNKTKIKTIHNFPENTNLEVEYVYSKASTNNGGSNAVAGDGRNVSVKIFHSLIAMPENDYEIRLDDPRVGYFMTQINDQSSLEATPYRDLIHRWNLVKKDPNAAISEPIKPITWWMENSTPMEIRPIIKKAGEKWNLAFEKAGFKNAIVIKQQPDDANWDAGDIRYNVLRWTSSPRPPFGGYGPSFVNPKTGEILGADIMLEFSSLANSLRNEKIFEKAALNDFHEEMTNQINSKDHNSICAASQMAQLNLMFGTVANTAFGSDKLENSKMLNEFLHFLILHEMGHTLGLNHNMKSSQLHSIADVNNTDITSKVGLTGSVMDYPSINYNLDRDNQGQYWTTTPGPYDDWAIQFGYQQMNTNEMEDLLSKSTQPQLAFGNDADDMRAPGKAIDPRVNVGDMSNDAIQYSINRIKLANEVAKEVLAKYKAQENGKSFQSLRNSYFVLTAQQAGSANTISRYIGGIYIDRGMNGQQGSTKPYTPVEKEKQQLAMKALNDFVFSSNAFTVPNDLYNYIATQRRGFNFFSRSEDPKIHSRILGIQRNVLRHLLHANTLQRITDSELYGNEYKLSEMMNDLNNAIFKGDIYGNVNSFRQNLQMEYTNMLISMLTGKQKGKYTNSAKSMALYNLKNIRTMAAPSGNISSKAHKQHLRTLIDNALKDIK